MTFQGKFNTQRGEAESGTLNPLVQRLYMQYVQGERKTPVVTVLPAGPRLVISV